MELDDVDGLGDPFRLSSSNQSVGPNPKVNMSKLRGGLDELEISLP
jgi:hypothetical protein